MNIKKKRKCKSETHSVFTEQTIKIAISSSELKKYNQLIRQRHTHTKQKSEKEEIKFRDRKYTWL